MNLLGILLSTVFIIISQIVQSFMAPFISVILGMFPSLSPAVANILNFLDTFTVYVTTILRWFLFTPAMWLMIFDYYFIKFSIWVLASAIRVALKLYNILKP